MAQRDHRIRVSFLCIGLGLFLLLTLGWSHARAAAAEEQQEKQQPATKQEAPQQQTPSQGQEAEQPQTPKAEAGVPGPIRFELTSRMELKYEQTFLKESGGQVYRILLAGSYAFSNMSFGIDELPIIKTDTPGVSEGFALGDLILRYGWVPYVSPSGNFGLDLVTNLTLPTGDFDKGLGAGRYALEPRLFLPYKFNQWFTIVPALYYMFTLAKQEDLAQDVSLLTLRLINIYYPSTKSYVLVEPRLYYDFEASKASGELRFQLGTMLTRNLQGYLEYDAGLGINRTFDGKVVGALRYFFR